MPHRIKFSSYFPAYNLQFVLESFSVDFFIGSDEELNVYVKIYYINVSYVLKTISNTTVYFMLKEWA